MIPRLWTRAAQGPFLMFVTVRHCLNLSCVCRVSWGMRPSSWGWKPELILPASLLMGTSVSPGPCPLDSLAYDLSWEDSNLRKWAERPHLLGWWQRHPALGGSWAQHSSLLAETAVQSELLGGADLQPRSAYARAALGLWLGVPRLSLVLLGILEDSNTP